MELEQPKKEPEVDAMIIIKLLPGGVTQTAVVNNPEMVRRTANPNDVLMMLNHALTYHVARINAGEVVKAVEMAGAMKEANDNLPPDLKKGHLIN